MIIRAIGLKAPIARTKSFNYLAASKCNLGLLVNFGEDSLKYKRIIL